MTDLSELARIHGLRLTKIKSDAGEEAALIEAMDDMGDFMEAQELDKALAVGKLQAGLGGVL